MAIREDGDFYGPTTPTTNSNCNLGEKFEQNYANTCVFPRHFRRCPILKYPNLSRQVGKAKMIHFVSCRWSTENSSDGLD